MFHRTIISASAAGVLLLGAAAPAPAVPVTVQLRVEGLTRTLFEGPVTVDVRTFRFNNPASAEYQCDATVYGGTSSSPAPTRGGAIAQAAETAGFETSGSVGQFGVTFATIAGESVAYDGDSGRFLAEYENGQFASFGSCADPVTTGDDVLFAYATGSEVLLAATGPATVAPGATAAITVTDQGTGAPVAGATVGGATTNAEGRAVVGPFADRGPHSLKATKDGAIRSNAVGVCVTDGADGFCATTKPAPTTTATAAPCTTTLGDDGFCGSPDRRAAFGTIRSMSEQQRFTRRRAPRELGGTVDPDGSGIADVRLRLTGNDGGRCTTFDATRQRFVRLSRCGASRGRWFSVGDAAVWKYLLPSRVARGRWVLDLEVRDKAGNVNSMLQRGRNRVVFHVS